MKEEEVDQYFKDKFHQFAPVPSADAWARLQSKLEPPRQKRPAMWVYYVAAMVTLAVVSGALFFWLKTGSLHSTENLARLKPITIPLQVNPSENLTIADATSKTLPLLAAVEPSTATKGAKTTTNDSSNSNTTSKPVKKSKKIRPGILIAAKTSKKKEKYNPVTESKRTPETNPTVAAVQALAAMPPTTEERVTEVIIKKAPDATIAYASDTEYQTTEEAIKKDISKKSRLVKNIFKQARNLKNGEKVELSTLGLNANYRIDVESKLFKQKYSKVINL